MNLKESMKLKIQIQIEFKKIPKKIKLINFTSTITQN